MNKQHILNEIRRTAKANGDKPIGRARFEKETGIKEGDWSGRYWARWSEAVQEAGFSPNQMNAALHADTAISHLAALIKQLGRFPVKMEMRMRKRDDPTFPNEKVFDRFGNKGQLAQAVLAYCEGQPDFDDVAAICRQRVVQGVEASSEEPASGVVADIPNTTIGTRDGYVYLGLLRIGREKRYKIGKAILVEQRINQIAVKLPEELELVHAITTDDAYGIEGYWHRRFADKCTNGEWFQLAPEDVRAFKRRKFM